MVEMIWPAAADSDPTQACPIGTVAEMVFSSWTTPILWTLHTHGRQRFIELHRQVPMISPKVLTQRLRQLERDGLLSRTYYPEVPPRVEYEITELGRSPRAAVQLAGHVVSHPLPEVSEARDAYDSTSTTASVPLR